MDWIDIFLQVRKDNLHVYKFTYTCNIWFYFQECWHIMSFRQDAIWYIVLYFKNINICAEGMWHLNKLLLIHMEDSSELFTYWLTDLLNL